jgi:hypothetical protein
MRPVLNRANEYFEIVSSYARSSTEKTVASNSSDAIVVQPPQINSLQFWGRNLWDVLPCATLKPKRQWNSTDHTALYLRKRCSWKRRASFAKGKQKSYISFRWMTSMKGFKTIWKIWNYELCSAPLAPLLISAPEHWAVHYGSITSDHPQSLQISRSSVPLQNMMYWFLIHGMVFDVRKLIAGVITSTVRARRSHEEMFTCMTSLKWIISRLTQISRRRCERGWM